MRKILLTLHFIAFFFSFNVYAENNLPRVKQVFITREGKDNNFEEGMQVITFNRLILNGHPVVLVYTEGPQHKEILSIYFSDDSNARKFEDALSGHIPHIFSFNRKDRRVEELSVKGLSQIAPNNADAKILLESNEGRDIPIVVVPAHAISSERSERLEAGLGPKLILRTFIPSEFAGEREIHKLTPTIEPDLKQIQVDSDELTFILRFRSDEGVQKAMTALIRDQKPLIIDLDDPRIMELRDGATFLVPSHMILTRSDRGEQAFDNYAYPRLIIPAALNIGIEKIALDGQNLIFDTGTHQLHVDFTQTSAARKAKNRIEKLARPVATFTPVVHEAVQLFYATSRNTGSFRLARHALISPNEVFIGEHGTPLKPFCLGALENLSFLSRLTRRNSPPFREVSLSELLMKSKVR